MFQRIQRTLAARQRLVEIIGRSQRISSPDWRAIRKMARVIGREPALADTFDELATGIEEGRITLANR